MHNSMNKPGLKGIKRLMRACIYSKQGFKAAWKFEEAFRVEALMMVILMPIAFVISNNAIEVVALCLPCFLVVITELLNSAIEAVVDRVGLEQHPLSGQAKDVASAAVSVSLLSVIFTWSVFIAYF